jgi:hypothetical protein
MNSYLNSSIYFIIKFSLLEIYLNFNENDKLKFEIYESNHFEIDKNI